MKYPKRFPPAAFSTRRRGWIPVYAQTFSRVHRPERLGKFLFGSFVNGTGYVWPPEHVLFSWIEPYTTVVCSYGNNSSAGRIVLEVLRTSESTFQAASPSWPWQWETHPPAWLSPELYYLEDQGKCIVESDLDWVCTTKDNQMRKPEGLILPHNVRVCHLLPWRKKYQASKQTDINMLVHFNLFSWFLSDAYL